VLEQTRTQVQTSVRASRARILNDSLSGLSTDANSDGLATFGGRVAVPELSLVESDGPSAVLVQVSAGSEADRGVVVGHTDARVTLLILVDFGNGESEDGGGEGEEGDEGGSDGHHVVEFELIYEFEWCFVRECDVIKRL
jgi:hypothetical protein